MGLGPIISATALIWKKSFRWGFIQPRPSSLAIDIKGFGVRCQKPPMICQVGRLVLLRIQQILPFSLGEYSNNLTVDVLIVHIPMELFLWL